MDFKTKQNKKTSVVNWWFRMIYISVQPTTDDARVDCHSQQWWILSPWRFPLLCRRTDNPFSWCRFWREKSSIMTNYKLWSVNYVLVLDNEWDFFYVLKKQLAKCVSLILTPNPLTVLSLISLSIIDSLGCFSRQRKLGFSQVTSTCTEIFDNVYLCCTCIRHYLSNEFNPAASVKPTGIIPVYCAITRMVILIIIINNNKSRY